MTTTAPLLPRPASAAAPRRPVVPIVRWRPLELPPPPELEQLAAIARELGRAGLV
jgi:hypothetical protein